MVVALVQARLETAAVLGAGPPAASLWQRLRRWLPWTVAAVLRARGVVWLGRVPSVKAATVSMERAWAPLRRRLGWPRLELDAREVCAASVGRLARKVHGVPAGCDVPRGGQPLPGWSTARDLLGGVVDPWVDPRLHRRLTWGEGGLWTPLPLPDPATSSLSSLSSLSSWWSDAARAALRAPWLHTTAPTVDGLLRAIAARLHGGPAGLVPPRWVDAALRCALDPRLRGFPQPPLPRSPGADPAVLRPLQAAARPGGRP